MSDSHHFSAKKPPAKTDRPAPFQAICGKRCVDTGIIGIDVPEWAGMRNAALQLLACSQRETEEILDIECNSIGDLAAILF